MTKLKARKRKAIKAIKDPTVTPAAPESALVLRLCQKDMSSSHGFTWPSSGPVEAKDWQPTKECGNGLHGWLWGRGDHSCCNYFNSEGARWLVVRVLLTDLIDLKDKVKFRCGE